MKVLVEVGGVWLDPTSVVALWQQSSGATVKFLGSEGSLTIPGATVDEVLDAIERAAPIET